MNPNIGQIVKAIKENRCVVFAGAGVSCHAGLPDWHNLTKKLYEGLNAKDLISQEFHSTISALLLNRDNVLKVMEILLLASNRKHVTSELRDILKPTKKSVVHDTLKKIKFRGFITTNYDRLLEEVIDPDSFRLKNSLDNLALVLTAVKTPGQFLLKLHGDIDDILPPDNLNVTRGASFMVLSMSDYAVLVQTERGEALRQALRAIFQDASILFLGYSFSDPDINQALEFLNRHLVFPNESWFIGLKNETLPNLPRNVTGIKLFNDWTELPTFLDEIYGNYISTPPIQGIKPREISEEDKRALIALGEFIHGLEEEDLCERILAGIIIEELPSSMRKCNTWRNGPIGGTLGVYGETIHAHQS